MAVTQAGGTDSFDASQRQIRDIDVKNCVGGQGMAANVLKELHGNLRRSLVVGRVDAAQGYGYSGKAEEAALGSSRDSA